MLSIKLIFGLMSFPPIPYVEWQVESNRSDVNSLKFLRQPLSQFAQDKILPLSLIEPFLIPSDVPLLSI